MIKKIASLSLALGLVGVFSAPAFAANKEGAKCTVPGKVVNVSGTRLVCAIFPKATKWINITKPAATTTPVAPTTAVAPTTTVAATTTTTVAANKTKPVVTLLRERGSSTSESVNYTVTGDKDIDCTTLSTTIGVDFTTKYISVINSIVQTSSKVCTVNAQSRAERDNTAYETVLRAATTFAISDTSGNVQTELLGSPQTIWVTRAP
jgi:hypothetical protein